MKTPKKYVCKHYNKTIVLNQVNLEKKFYDKNMTFGLMLKSLMIENKITQQELASRIGVSQRAVSKWVNLQSEPTESAIVACAKYFNVTSDYILRLEDESGRKYTVNTSVHNNFGNINFHNK